MFLVSSFFSFISKILFLFKENVELIIQPVNPAHEIEKKKNEMN